MRVVTILSIFLAGALFCCAPASAQENAATGSTYANGLLENSNHPLRIQFPDGLVVRLAEYKWVGADALCEFESKNGGLNGWLLALKTDYGANQMIDWREGELKKAYGDTVKRLSQRVLSLGVRETAAFEYTNNAVAVRVTYLYVCSGAFAYELAIQTRASGAQSHRQLVDELLAGVGFTGVSTVSGPEEAPKGIVEDGIYSNDDLKFQIGCPSIYFGLFTGSDMAVNRKGAIVEVSVPKSGLAGSVSYYANTLKLAEFPDWRMNSLKGSESISEFKVVQDLQPEGRPDRRVQEYEFVSGGKRKRQRYMFIGRDNHMLEIVLAAEVDAWKERGADIDCFFDSCRAGDEYIRDIVTEGGPVVSGFAVVGHGGKTGGFEIFVVEAGSEHAANITRHNADEYAPAWSPDGRKIAFISSRANELKRDLYVMDSDGANVRRLTWFVGANNPRWSPDGQRIAFDAEVGKKRDVFVIGQDGAGQRNLTRSDSLDEMPDWSPDGKTIAFRSTRGYQGGLNKLWAMDADGGAQRELCPYADSAPRWSPDGKSILYVRNKQACLVDPDGKNPRRVLFNDGADVSPCWSPEGLRIGYLNSKYQLGKIQVRNADGPFRDAVDFILSCSVSTFDWSPAGPDAAIAKDIPGRADGIICARRQAGPTSAGYVTDDLLVMNADGSAAANVTESDFPLFELAPVWSPDRKRIAFHSNRDAKQENGNPPTQIYVARADGSNPVNLSRSETQDTYPEWSPDGGQIAFLRQDKKGAACKLYVMSADGSNQKQIGEVEVAADTQLSWFHDGTRIAYTAKTGDACRLFEIRLDRPDSPAALLQNVSGQSKDPAWSADGARIAFVNDGRNGKWDLCIADADGGNVTRLTEADTDYAFPDWSPDGKALLMNSFPTSKLFSLTLQTKTIAPLGDGQHADWGN